MPTRPSGSLSSAWKDDPKGHAKILRFRPATREWGVLHYPLGETPSGWMGLSEIAAAGADSFVVIERNNQWGDAAVKRLYRFSVAYSDQGACTNQAESYFSRLRRAEIGIHHHISGRYLGSYANEMAWREDTRRLANGTLYSLAIKAVMAHPVSINWRGYWQRGWQTKPVAGNAD